MGLKEILLIYTSDLKSQIVGLKIKIIFKIKLSK